MAKKTPKKRGPARPAKAARKTDAGHPLAPLLQRIADALERQAPPLPATADLASDAFVWHAESGDLTPVKFVSRVPLRLLKGIERQSEQLLANTQQHADGYPANNALLWGSRGAGKSSLVKAVQAAVNETRKGGKRLALGRGPYFGR